MSTQARATLDPIPKKMEHLPFDKRGFVVPWFVEWIDGQPEFRAMSGRKWFMAVKQKLCWVCGSSLQNQRCFVAGPMCGINRISSEPPSHIDCARWSARNCPFLSNPNMVRREDELVNNAECRERAAGVLITRNPGVTMLWFTREYEIINDGKGKPLIIMGTPQGVEWYARGRPATREEVNESIDEGLPALEATCDGNHACLAAIQEKRRRFERWLPK